MFNVFWRKQLLKYNQYLKIIQQALKIIKTVSRRENLIEKLKVIKLDQDRSPKWSEYSSKRESRYGTIKEMLKII